MFIGEGPGKEENFRRVPFVGKSGIEFARYLWRSCYRMRESVFITNLVKYHVPDDKDPTEEDIRRDIPILEDELRRVRPLIVCCLGRCSTRYFLGDVDMEAVHGMAHYRHPYVVVPIYHPAAGLHNTELQARVWWDFQRLGEVLRERIAFQESTDGFLGSAAYAEVRRPREEGRSGTLNPAAVDTEGSVAKPWCLTYSEKPGSAFCIRKGHSKFNHIILHNSLHDLAVLRALDVEYKSFDDTMIKAYELGIEPQGLKALALRHCGMKMREYSEIIGPANRKMAAQYLGKVGQWLNKQSRNGSTASPTTSSRTRRRMSANGGKKSSRTALRKK